MAIRNDRQLLKAGEIQTAIRRVLLADWDPIGVAKAPEADGEYDSYVGGVCRLLSEGAPPERIAEHLRAIECDAMGLAPRAAVDLLPVARRLCKLHMRARVL